MKEEGSFRKILRSEVTWALFIIGIIWGCVQTVVLPLQKLQIQVSQIQLDIARNNKNYDDLSKEEANHETRISILESRK